MDHIYLFPVSNAILFKKVSLPFHVFEDRYREMIYDAIDRQIPVGVISFDPYDYYTGKICVAGIPHILSTYPDGKLDIYITGQTKYRLGNLVEEDPYKVFEAKELFEDMDVVDDQLEFEIDILKNLLKRWALHFLPDPLQRESFALSLEDVELLVNFCAVFLVDEVKLRREVMEASSLQQKVKILIYAIGPKEISLGPFMPTLRF
ncbi:MAG TPA: LON peptidase substrate-binding domain-containing protein [Bacteriovoracaceae bacterium]|nr:LON peptidase substrate-binding domain-containing protein [Bacteriovoracaceae bacterium]